MVLSRVSTTVDGVAAGARTRLAVLENRQFRRLLEGRSVSVFGDGLYSVTAMWLVFELTGSTVYTGLAGALTRAPGFLKLFVGPLVDRMDLGRVLTLSEVAQGVLVLVVPIAAFLGRLNVYVVLATMPLLAVMNLFSGPAQTALLPRLVDEESLVRGNSVFSVTTQVVDATTRGVAGVLIAVLGPVALYLVDAATFAVAAVLFFTLQVPDATPADDGGSAPADDEGSASTDDQESAPTDDEESVLADDEESAPVNDGERDSADDGEESDDATAVSTYVSDFREGIGVLTGSVVGLMVVSSWFANFLTGLALAVLPAFADAIGGSEMYGLLLAGLTVGRVVGSVSASAVDERPLGAVTVVGFLAAGALWVGAVVVGVPLVTVALFTVSRVFIGVYNVSFLATFQAGVPNELVGRVTAAASGVSNFVYPAGMLLGGFLGGQIGSEATMLAGGVGSFLVALYWLLVPSLRRFGPPTAVSSGEFG